MTLWLLEQSASDLLDQALASNWQPTEAQVALIEARNSALASGDTSRFLRASGKTAEIHVTGALTKHPDVWAMIFGGGGTSYAEIIAAVRAAENDPNVEGILFHVDSPGGHTSGLFEALAEIQAAKKPMRVLASQANSAAYALAAAAGPIEATSPGASFGSIGIIAAFRPTTNLITMRSSDAPLKNPDPSTDEGKREIQAYMDGLHSLFVEAIAQGRGVKPEAISRDFGRGASFLAGQAKQRGMIDSIRTPQLKVVHNKTTASALDASEKTTMDLRTLKSQHPDLYEAVLQEGVTQERDRVSGHLEMAKSLNAPQSVAVEAILAGTRVDHPVTLAKYYGLARNNQDQEARAEDDKAVAAATQNAEAAPAKTEDLHAQVAKLMGYDLGEAK